MVVTGAAGQLGASLCQAFTNIGANVVGIDIAQPKRRLKKVKYFRADITDKIQVSRVFNAIMRKLERFDVLINNAGVGTFAPFESRTEEEFDRVLSINLKGSFLCIQKYVDIYDHNNMKTGAIVNIASIFGVVSSDFRNYTDCTRRNSEVYGAAKAGLIQMTKYFAVHLAERGVRVNAISPGGIINKENPQGADFQKNYSSRCPMKRMAYVEEMAGAAIYLASDSASYTTGQNIVIDGGLTCW